MIKVESMAETRKKRLFRAERRGALVYLAEMAVIALVELAAGIGTVVVPRYAAVSPVLVLLSCLSFYFALMASAYFESIRSRGDKPTLVKEVVWAAPKLRLYSLFANAGLIVTATALLWIARAADGEFAIALGILLCLVGLRVVFLARDYHAARVRELEARD